MNVIEVTKDKVGGWVANVPSMEDSFVAYIKTANYEGFAVKFKCQGEYYYQHLMLKCRGSAQSYYEPAKALYRHIRKQKQTKTLFRILSGIKYI